MVLERLSVASRCVACRLPVRGLYAACPGCGHGGHLRHLQLWFSSQPTCPSGCGHACDLSSFGVGPAARGVV